MIRAIKNEFFGWAKLVGMRDRLRCPHCGAVGTWKPHGGWYDGLDLRCVRRWLCKWCGGYDGPEGVMAARYSAERGWWVLPDDEAWERGVVPVDTVEWDPWRG